MVQLKLKCRGCRHRYSPQESTVSIDAPPNVEVIDLSSGDQSQRRYGAPTARGRVNPGTLMTTNPLWHGDDVIQEYPAGMNDRTTVVDSAERERRREMWQLLPETPERPLSRGERERAANTRAAALLRACSPPDDRSENAWEYRLGPK